MENDLMKDPFLIPRLESKPRVVFTRSKVIGTKEFELKVRPQKTATGAALSDQELGSTLLFKIKRECRASSPTDIFKRRGPPDSPGFERLSEPLLDDFNSDHEDLMNNLQAGIIKRVVEAEPTIVSDLV